MAQSTKQVRVVPLGAPVPTQAMEATAFFDEDGNPVDLGGGGGGGGSVAWEDVTGVPSALTSAQSAGTASIRAIGTSGTTAAAGNHSHDAQDVSATAVDGGTATDVQGILDELAARIVALETDAG